MQQRNWNNFGLKGESKQKSFEDLCMYLLCRKLKVSEIEAYHDQPGIETEPFVANGKKYGFQVKFFDSNFNWKQIEKSISKAITTYRELDQIFIYTNKNRTRGKQKGLTKCETSLKNNAEKQKITLKYVTEKSLSLLLDQPSNLDLAQIYFGIGDELGFIKNSVNPKILTFIQSNEYTELPIEKSGKTVQNLPAEIISNTAKVSILSGNPGSGKTIVMHKLLAVFGGLDKNNLREQIDVLLDNKAVPILINLKNCATDSLENILRNRKDDNKVNRQSLNFTYLFDGLDELNENIADNILSQMHELYQKSDTTKIIISCRSGNINQLKAKSYFKNIQEYKIVHLEYIHVLRFFQQRKSKNKNKKLKNLNETNKKFIKELKDILLIKLFWDSIEEIDEKSNIIDLFDKEINLLLNDTKHRKNIENLNLLNPKKNAIIKLNQDIAFNFQKKFQFRFSQDELQHLILKEFPRLDYNSINSTLDYIAGLFFENSYSEYNNFNITNSYIYRHRVIQEYFFIQKLKAEYEKNPRIIRELKIITNKECFENLFLIYLRKEYEKENNLAGCIELNLIDIYLGKHEDFAADDAYYMNSREFIPALASQEEISFNELMEDENLKLKDKISINFDELKKQFKIWRKDKNDYKTTDYIKNIWKNVIPSLIEKIAIFWKANKKDTANEFIAQFKTIRDLYNENKFIKNLRESGEELLSDPFGNKFENWIYYRLLIDNEKTKDIFKTLVRKNYKNFSEKRDYILNESENEKLLKSFFRISLDVKKMNYLI